MAKFLTILTILFLFSIQIHSQERVILPITKNCSEGISNEEKRACINTSVQRLFQKKLRVKKHLESFHPGKNIFYVDFIINKEAEIELINTNTNNQDFDEEIERVLKKLKFEAPANFKNKAVNIKFSVPLVYPGSTSKNKPNPLYSKTKIYLESIDLDKLSEKPRYNFTEAYDNLDLPEEKVTTKSDIETHKLNAQNTPRRYFSTLYNHINIYMINGYLENGINEIPIHFSVDDSGKLVNVEVNSKSEKINEYIKEIFESLPTFSPGYLDSKPIAIDYKMLLVYGKRS